MPQRVMVMAENAILSKRLAVAKALHLPQPVRKKIFSRWVPRPNLLEGSRDTAVDLNDPICSDNIIANLHAAPKGVEQLVDQWLAVEKDITIPGTEVNKIREDIKKKSGTDSRDERPTEARDHKTIAGL